MSADPVIRATIALRKALAGRTFPSPADFVYQPLDYAWASHEAYLRRYAASGPKKVLFLGMNPGPFGMAQTGVPFGEVAAVRDWMGLAMPVGRPEREHPGKKVTGFDCHRSEVSGRRLWGLCQERFGTPEAFFADHLVHNYCPLLFLENTKQGRNVIPEEAPGGGHGAGEQGVRQAPARAGRDARRRHRTWASAAMPRRGPGRRWTACS